MITKDDVKLLVDYFKEKEIEENMRKLILKLELLNEIQEANEKLGKLMDEEK